MHGDGDPREGYWVILGQHMYDALLRVEAGEIAELVWIEMCANCEFKSTEESE